MKVMEDCYGSDTQSVAVISVHLAVVMYCCL